MLAGSFRSCLLAGQSLRSRPLVEPCAPHQSFFMHVGLDHLRRLPAALLLCVATVCALTGCKPGAFSAAPTGPNAQGIASTPNQQLLAQQQTQQQMEAMKNVWTE